MAEGKGPTIKVVQFVTVSGRSFYMKSEEFDNDRSRLTVDRLRDKGDPCYQINLIDMSEAEYNRFPTTNESAELFG